MCLSQDIVPIYEIELSLLNAIVSLDNEAVTYTYNVICKNAVIQLKCT